MEDVTANEQQEQPQQDAFANAIERVRLDEKSFSPEISERRSAIQTPQATPAKVANGFDNEMVNLVQEGRSLGTSDELAGEFEKMRERNAQEGEPEPKEKEAEAARIPKALSQFDPSAVAEAAAKWELSEKELQDPRWQEVIAKELSAEDEAAQAQTEQQQQQQTQQSEIEQFQSYTQELHRLATDERLNDSRMVAAFDNSLALSLGANPSDPAAMQQVSNLSLTLREGGINLMSTMVPMMVSHYLPAMLNEIAPNIVELTHNANRHYAWENIKSSDPSFKDLPPYGTPEFNALRDEMFEKNPALANMRLTNPDGSRMSYADELRATGMVLAKLATRGKLSVEEQKALVAQGEKKAKESQRRVAVSSAMGHKGKSAGGFQPKADDSFREGIINYMKAQKSGNWGS